MRILVKRVFPVFLSLLFLVSLAGPVFSAPEMCEDHGVLHDVEHYTSRMGWGARSGKLMIHLWDSPAHIAVVGTLNPGAYVIILAEKDGYYKVRSSDGAAGWMKKDHLAAKLPREKGAGGECFG